MKGWLILKLIYTYYKKTEKYRKEEKFKLLLHLLNSVTNKYT